MTQNTQQQQTITLLGTRVSKRALEQLIHNTLHQAEQAYKQVYDALKHGVAPKAAYNLPKHTLFLLRRYERALQIYNNYKHHHNKPAADNILTLAKPTPHHSIAYFIFGSTSDKHDAYYIKYRTTLLKHKRKLHLVCDCPDFTNRGAEFPCKHMMASCMWLRDYMRGGRVW